MPAKAQFLEAHYKIYKPIYSTDENGMEKNIANLELDGFLYQQKNKFIYFNKPLYLDKYPDGYIDVNIDRNNVNKIAIVMDTIQSIRYFDLDSSISRSRFNIPGPGNYGINVKSNLKKNNINWQFLQDTKEINGLKCQKAQFINRNSKLQWIVWFCPDVAAFGGPDYITGIPGIVVEGENKISNETFVLESYNNNISLPDNIFWPKEFDQPFR